MEKDAKMYSYHVMGTIYFCQFPRSKRPSMATPVQPGTGAVRAGNICSRRRGYYRDVAACTLDADGTCPVLRRKFVENCEQGKDWQVWMRNYYAAVKPVRP